MENSFRVWCQSPVERVSDNGHSLFVYSNENEKYYSISSVVDANGMYAMMYWFFAIIKISTHFSSSHLQISVIANTITMDANSSTMIGHRVDS